MENDKIKIAVFGDSFADRCYPNKTLSWVDHLAKKYSVDNYAVSGSSLYYSISKFQEHHSQYDKVLFVVTTLGRILLPKHSCFEGDFDHERCLTSLWSTDFFVNEYENMLAQPNSVISDYEKNKIKQKIIIWKAAEDYFKYISNPAYDEYVHRLMLNDIIPTRPDTILIPAFSKNFIKDKRVFSMHDIQMKENIAWGINPAISYRSDIRNCHLTAENNEIFAQKAEEWINGAPVTINLDDFVNPSMESRKFYISEFE